MKKMKQMEYLKVSNIYKYDKANNVVSLVNIQEKLKIKPKIKVKRLTIMSSK